MEGFAFTQDFLGVTPESLRGGSERTQELSQIAVTYMERVLLNARAAFNVEDGEDKAAVAELRQGALRAGNYEFAGFIEKAQKNLMVVEAARQTAQERINEPNPNSSERKIL